MNQISHTTMRSSAVQAAFYMVAAGAVFALVNLSTQYLGMRLGMPSTSTTFWQYAVALAVCLPWLVKTGLGVLRTKQPVLHILRVICAALGVQAWVAGLVHVPIWQAIALIMTSPFFVTIGASLFLDERVGAQRLSATMAGFVGGMIILAPWSDAFSVHALLPVLAAAFWAATSLFTKKLTGQEPAETVTVFLLILLTPINAVLAFSNGIVIPTGDALWLIVFAGVMTAIAQWLIALAYATADAAYVQPFDHVKLPFNVLGGWIVFGYIPGGQLWIGAALIVAASLFIMQQEKRLSVV
ncbi:MAG: EamA family transporter [Hyphomicrobiales bacterium]|nr:MAG: EamA family transporter [Hyphomicrobiales bacterium]